MARVYNPIVLRVANMPENQDVSFMVANGLGIKSDAIPKIVVSDVVGRKLTGKAGVERVDPIGC